MASSSEKIDYIRSYCYCLTETEINAIYKQMCDVLAENKKKALTIIINKILVDINRPEIEELEQVKIIEKNHLSSKSTEKIVENNINVLFGPFCKNSYNYHTRSTYKHFFYTFLKKACGEIRYTLLLHNKKKVTFVSFLKN